jgi:tRNA(Leu) C34 or U34 (ribose-2'-O)-methylase TrmL
MPFNTPSSSGTDFRICNICNFDYDASAQPYGHKCELRQLEIAAILAYDSNQMDKYDDLNRMIAAKKAKSSTANGRKGGHARKPMNSHNEK